MVTVVVTTLMEAVVFVVGNKPCERNNRKSVQNEASAVDSLICNNKHTREEQLLDNSRSLKEATASLEKLLEK